MRMRQTTLLDQKLFTVAMVSIFPFTDYLIDTQCRNLTYNDSFVENVVNFYQIPFSLYRQAFVRHFYDTLT